MKDTRDEYLWSELYRPRTIEDCVLPAAIKEVAAGHVKKGRLPNLLLSGGQGSGKTTLARAMCEEVGADYIVINASNENGIDTLRTKITQFASTVSFESKKKVIILDEADYMNCLEENTSIQTPTGEIALSELQPGVKYDVLSYNLTTQTVEQDTAEIVSDFEEEVFEVILESGKHVICTADHPFIVSQNNFLIEKTIEDDLLFADVVVV